MTKKEAIECIKEEINFHRKMEGDWAMLHSYTPPENCPKPSELEENHHRIRIALEIAAERLEEDIKFEELVEKLIEIPN